MKKVLSFMIVCTLILAMYTSTAFASNDDIYFPSGSTLGTTATDPDAMTMILSTYTEPAIEVETYCADYNVDMDWDAPYQKGGLADRDISIVLYNSFPLISLSELEEKVGIDSITEAQAVSATQYAVWHYTNGFDYSSNNDENVQKIYDYLTGLHADKASATVDVQSKILSSGDVQITITYPTYAGKNDDQTNIPLKHSYSIDLKSVYPGTTETIETSGDNQVVTIVIPKADFTSDINFTAYVNGTQVQAYAYEFECVDGDSQKLVGGLKEKEVEVGASADVTVQYSNDKPPETVYYKLIYTAETGGSVSGDASQTVESGKDGTTVTAVPTTGYHFVQWSDGNTNASRTELNVTKDQAYIASFEADTTNDDRHKKHVITEDTADVTEPEIPYSAPVVTEPAITTEPAVIPQETQQIVLDTQIPYSAPALPKTGGMGIELFYGLSAIALGTGFALRRKSK